MGGGRGTFRAGASLPPGILVRCWMPSGPRAVHGPRRSGPSADTGGPVEGEVDSGPAVGTSSGLLEVRPRRSWALQRRRGWARGPWLARLRPSHVWVRNWGMGRGWRSFRVSTPRMLSLAVSEGPGVSWRCLQSRPVPPLGIVGRYQCGLAAPGPMRAGVCCGLTEQRLGPGESAAPRGRRRGGNVEHKATPRGW